MQQLTGREEVKALSLQTIFEDATQGKDTAFSYSDADTFEFATRRARTATQKLVDAEGQRFSGRIRVLTDPGALTITLCQAGKAHPAAPAARRRVERQAAAKTSVVIQTRKLQGGSKAVGRGTPHPDEFQLEDATLVEDEILYSCQPGCGFSVGPEGAAGDDIQCAHCGHTNASALKEFGGNRLDEEGQEVLPIPMIRPAHRIEEGGRAVRYTSAGQSRKQRRDSEVLEAITEEAEEARRARAKKGRDSLARRRGRRS